MLTWLRVAVWCGAMALGHGYSFGAASRDGLDRVQVSPVPDWVRMVEWAGPDPLRGGGKSEGTRHLAYERQSAPSREETFVRVVALMQNHAGVQDSGSLTIHFDPEYQNLLLHRIQLHRAGDTLDRLDLTKLKVIQPELGLQGHIYTGARKAILFLEDLRVGDVLEYAYTVRGANPAVAGHYAERIVTRSSIPVDRQRIRVVWSSSRSLQMRQYETPEPPEIQHGPDGTEYLWDFTGLPAIPIEDSLPAGYEPYPYIELSDFGGWRDVVAWALPLYALDEADPPPTLRSVAAGWIDVAESDEARTRKALEFVQDEIRYTGLEIGPDSFRPARPELTIERRFGDCKDKARLLCVLLRHLGIEAYPVLVNTSLRESVAGRLPSPYAFDHLIVKVLLNGGAVWVDPTLSHQGGALGDRHLPLLGRGLVLAPGVGELEEIPARGVDHGRRVVTSRFRMPDYSSPARFTVITSYHGNEADEMRAYVARADADDIALDYLNFYARYYPGIRDPDALELTDDRMRNRLTVVERYWIDDFWRLDDSSQRRQATVYPDNMMGALTEPTTRLRRMPLGIVHPIRREQELIIDLPTNDWALPADAAEVRHDSFLFRYRRVVEGQRVRFQYECETLAGEVSAHDVGTYLTRVEEMDDLLGDVLYRPDDSWAGWLADLNWFMIVLAAGNAMLVALGSVWFLSVTRSSARAGLPVGVEPRLQGLGGWLILVGAVLILAVIQRIVLMATNWDGYFSILAWQAVAMPQGEQYHPLFGPLLMFEVSANVWLLGLNALVLWLFFGKRRWFPALFLVLIIGNAVAVVMDEVWTRFIPAMAAESGQQGLGAAPRVVFFAMIWSLYIMKSRRVKATFVR